MMIHSESAQEAQRDRLKRLHQEVHMLYKRSQPLKILNDPDIKEVFKLDEAKRKTKGVVALETWTKLAAQVLHVGEERLKLHRENGLERWLNREQTYQEALVGSSI